MSAVESVGPQALPALQEQVEQIIAEAKRQGASACEVAVSLEQGLSTTVRQREVETVEFNRDQGFGITLYVGQRKGSASTSASGPEAIRETVAAALAIAKHTSEDEASGLADAALMAKDVQDFDLFHQWDITPEQAIEQALACEAAAFAADSRIKNADGTTLSTHQGCRVYGNSHGFVGGYASTRHSLSCVMIAEADGQMQRDYWYDVNRQGNLLADPVSIGQRAAQRAASRLGARPVPTCEVPVLFSAELAGGLFGSFLSAISGGSLYLDLGNQSAALADLNHAIELNDHTAQAFYQRGYVYIAMKNFDAAVTDFNRAIRLAPEMAWAYQGRGTALMSKGQLLEAMNDFNRAIERDPNMDTAYCNRGLVKLFLGDESEAQKDFAKCLRLKPEFKAELERKIDLAKQLRRIGKSEE